MNLRFCSQPALITLSMNTSTFHLRDSMAGPQFWRGTSTSPVSSVIKEIETAGENMISDGAGQGNALVAHAGTALTIAAQSATLALNDDLNKRVEAGCNSLSGDQIGF
jgi:hypothetical protein